MLRSVSPILPLNPRSTTSNQILVSIHVKYLSSKTAQWINARYGELNISFSRESISPEEKNTEEKGNSLKNDIKLAKKNSFNGAQNLESLTENDLIQTTVRVKSFKNSSSLYGLWGHMFWSRERLEFESDLNHLKPANLLHLSSGDKDIELWGYLLEYRHHAHGSKGIRMFWKTIVTRGVLLPVSGALATKFWTTFLELGFEDHQILNEICDYADMIFKIHKIRWLLLYVSILEHVLIHQNGKNALKWHERLFPHHPPGAHRFRAFFREVLHQVCGKNQISALKLIYKQSPYRNVYSGVVPLYFRRGEVKNAVDWHFFLLENNDLPSHLRMVEPLIRHLQVSNKPLSTSITESLDKARAFITSTTNKSECYSKLSGELINVIHGKTFGIPVKQYNDELGARWFATRWISLDTAINAIKSLGIREIGPLSLQAIVLRDPTADSISNRINQLQNLGISLGNSKFVQAVKHFAQTQNDVYLQGLLQSDQHPDQLDDFKLQNKLLFAYAKAQSWSHFYRTLEIQSLDKKNAEVYKKNMVVKLLLSYNRVSDAQRMLDNMQCQGIQIESSTISLIISRIMRPRRRGRCPPRHTKELNLSINILRDMMLSGNYVPAYHWREIIRRLGMLGKLDHLESVCLTLGRWYLSSEVNQPRARKLLLENRAIDPRHPTCILFDNNFQRAVIAWGFIHPLNNMCKNYAVLGQRPSSSLHPQVLPNITFGINLLNKLHKLGVHIDGCIVGRAILNRLITYFGPIISTRKYNRDAQILIRGRLMEFLEQLDDALGKTYFTSWKDLSTYLKKLINMKILKLQRKNKLQLHITHPVEKYVR